MTQINPPHTAVNTKITDNSREDIGNNQSRFSRINKLMKFVYASFFLAVIISVYILAHRSLSNESAANDPLPVSSDQALEVEVLDGAGSMKVALHITNILRSKGYDVVEMKRNGDGLVERTYVVDRSGNLEAARKLGTALGIAADKVFQKIDRNLYLDITVVVGKDFSQLKVFKALNERSKR